MQVVAICCNSLRTEKHSECGPPLRLSMAVVRRILRFLQQEVLPCSRAVQNRRERCRTIFLLRLESSGIPSCQAKKDPEQYQKFFKGYSYFLKAGLPAVPSNESTQTDQTLSDSCFPACQHFPQAGVIEDKEGNFSRPLPG